MFVTSTLNEPTQPQGPSQAASLVSIITPSYNHAPYIRQTIESVLAQDYPHVEHLVVDGGSTDGTVAILREYGERYPGRFRWISEPDHGQSDALNKGIGLAKGDFIGWQNSDDYYLPHVFAEPIQYLISHPDVAMVYSQRLDIDHTNATYTYGSGPFSYERLLDHDYIPSQAAFFRRGALLECGCVATDLHYAMDYDLWLRLGLAHRIVFLPGVRGVWRLLPEVKTVSGAPRATRELAVAVERALASPLFPLTLVQPGRLALQRHRLRALVRALMAGSDDDATALLSAVVRDDPALSQWSVFCGQLLFRRLLLETAFHEDIRRVLDQVPKRVLELLRAAGFANTPQSRQVINLFYFFSLLRALERRDPHCAAARFARVLQSSPLWLARITWAEVALPTLHRGQLVHLRKLGALRHRRY